VEKAIGFACFVNGASYTLAQFLWVSAPPKGTSLGCTFSSTDVWWHHLLCCFPFFLLCCLPF